ncbi:MAG: NUDIX domain-containing protein [Bacteroidales bacterium]|nr:NUDIX domain-containing protein [Bacteroidales bacterium]
MSNHVIIDKTNEERMAKTRQDVACAVIIRNGMILAARRGEELSNSGAWEFPGGKPQANETPRECAIRRVKEELNINICIKEELPSYEVASEKNNDKTFVIHPFLAEIEDGKVMLHGHSYVAWFMPIQLMGLAWPPSDMPIIDSIVDRILQTGKIA